MNFTNRIITACLVALAAMATVAMRAPAGAHGEQAWMMKYKNAYGQSCCHENDTVVIPNSIAADAKIGSVVIAPFASGHVLVTVNKIHATEDRQGRAMISTYGCLFKAFGG